MYAKSDDFDHEATNVDDAYSMGDQSSVEEGNCDNLDGQEKVLPVVGSFGTVVEIVTRRLDLSEKFNSWFHQSHDTRESKELLLKHSRDPVLGLTLPAKVITLCGNVRSSFVVEDMECDGDSKEMELFVYLGVETGIKRCLDIQNHSNRELWLQFNFDGAPIFNENSRAVWPITCPLRFYRKISSKKFNKIF